MTDFFGDPDGEQEPEAKKTGGESGNKFWRLPKALGRPLQYETPEQLIQKAYEYFDWVDDNPLKLHKVFATGGGWEKKARAMGIQSLCVHLGISHTTFLNYKKRDDGIGKAANHIQQVMDAWNIEIACSGLGNGNIIARIIGLSEKIVHGNDPDNPLPTPETVVQYQLPSNGRD